MNVLKESLHGATWGALALALGLLPARADYKSTVLADGPAGYWRFSEIGVVTPPDLATNLGTAGAESQGVYYGNMSTMQQQPGVLSTDTAARFDGSSQGVLIPTGSAAASVAAPFTVEAWIKPDVVSGTLVCPIGSLYRSTPADGWIIYVSSSGWNLRLGNDSGYQINITGGGGPTPGTWYHVMASYDGAAAILYVNGVQVATGSSSTCLPNTTWPMGIGARGDTAFGFPGSVDEVVVYTNSPVLSANDAAAHFAAATTNAAGYAGQILAYHPLGYWRLDDPPVALPVAANSGSLGSAANGSYRYWSTTTADLDGPTFPGFEANNTTLETSGTNGIVAIPPLNLNTNTVTFECWIKRNGDQSSFAGILFHRGGSGTATGLDFHDTSNNLGYHWSDQSDTYSWISGLIPPDGSWAYTALAVSPDQALLYLYDGTNWSSAVNTVSHPVQAFAATTRVGADNDTVRFFNGLIDEAAIYRATLTEGQLHTHALAGFGGTNPPVLVTDPPVVSPSGTIYATTPFSVMADAYGQPPLSFQWRTNGVSIPGATNFIYVKASASTSDSGNYDLIVTNAYGAVTSQVAVVVINPAVPPSIVQAPSPRLVYVGGGAFFDVVAGGTTPFSYQWQHANTNLPGATNATLVITAADSTKAGTYKVLVTNVAGSTNAAADLTLLTPAAGSYVADLIGAQPLGYWRLGEEAGSVAYDYFGGNDGAYNSVILGAAGALVGDPDTAATFDGSSSFVAIPPTGTFTGPAFTNITQATFICWVKRNGPQGHYKGLLAMRPLSTGLYLNNDDTVNYAWRDDPSTWGFDSGLVPPDGQWALAAAVVRPTQAILYLGSYSGGFVSITNNVTHSPANFTTGPFAIGQDINYTYENRFFSGDLDEAAIFTNALTGAQIQALFNTGLYGTTTPPYIIRQPAVQPATVGATVTLSVLAGGSAPLAYQWQKNGTPIPGATASAYTLANVYFTDAGNYSVYITNHVPGATNSAGAALTVLPPPTFANLTNDLVLHLKFDGNSYFDSSGRGNDASPVGAPTFLSGRLGQAIHLSTASGANNYLTVSDVNGDLTFDAINSFSVSFWLRYSVGFNDLPIMGNAINSTYQKGWVLTEDGGKFEWTLVGVDIGQTIADPVGGPLINDGAWHQLVAVFDRSSGTASSFVDGVKVDNRSIITVGSLITGSPLTLGQDPTGNYGVNGAFDLDDVGIWRRALTDYEAESIYAAARLNQSFDIYGPVKVYVNHVGSNVDVSWQAGTLLQAANVGGPYTPAGGTVPFFRTTPTNAATFFRVQQ